MTDERRILLKALWVRLRDRDLKWLIHESIVVPGTEIRAPDPETLVWVPSDRSPGREVAVEPMRVVTFRVEHFPNATYGVFVEDLCVEAGHLVL